MNPAGPALRVQLPEDKIQWFRTWLNLLRLDQSTRSRAAISWILFLVFAFLVPSLSFLVVCWNCDEQRKQYDVLAEIALTGVAAMSFFCLSISLRAHRLSEILFVDSIREDSQRVRNGYFRTVDRSFIIFFSCIVPCFLIELGDKVSRYSRGTRRIGQMPVNNVFGCLVELSSWCYRTLTFYSVCIIFRQICCLQLLRIEELGLLLQGDSEALEVSNAHTRIKAQLDSISNRHQKFILWAVMLVIAGHLGTLFVILSRDEDVTLRHVAYSVICSITLLLGLLVVLISAASVTHKAQALGSLSSGWHVRATMAQAEQPAAGYYAFIPRATIQCLHREALVMHLGHQTGINIYGFPADRDTFNIIFGVELAIVLWILSETVKIS